MPWASGVQPKAPHTFSFFLTYRECKNKRESAEPYDTLPRTYHLASTMNNSWPTWLPLNRPLPLFLPQIPDITSFHPCIFSSKDLQRESKHHHNSIILLETFIPPPRSGPGSCTCVGRRWPTSAHGDSPREQPMSTFSGGSRQWWAAMGWSGVPASVRVPGGTDRGTACSHSVVLKSRLAPTSGAGGPFTGHCWASPL